MKYDELKEFKKQCEKMLTSVYKHRDNLKNEDLQSLRQAQVELAHTEELEINIEEILNILAWFMGEE